MGTDGFIIIGGQEVFAGPLDAMIFVLPEGPLAAKIKRLAEPDLSLRIRLCEFERLPKVLDSSLELAVLNSFRSILSVSFELLCQNCLGC